MKRKLKDIPSAELYGIHGFLNWHLHVAKNYTHIAKDADFGTLIKGKTYYEWSDYSKELEDKRNAIDAELFSRIDEEINFD